MNDDNINNILDQNFFLPKEDIFSAFLNAGSTNKINDNIENESFDHFFKVENNFNIFDNCFENNNFSNSIINLNVNPEIETNDEKSNNIKQIQNENMSKNINSEITNDNDVLGRKRRKNLIKTDTVENNHNLTIKNLNNISNMQNFKNFHKKPKSVKIVKKSEDFSSSFSVTSENTDKGKVIFKTFKGDDEGLDMRKDLRLQKNRVSARKCRLKKKNYLQTLEQKIGELEMELEKNKNMNKKERLVEGMINTMENKEKYILNYSSTNGSAQKQKYDSNKKDYINNQRNLITELMKKMIKNICPIEYKIFSSKFIKLKEFEANDSFEKMVLKIDENIQILSELYMFNGDENSNIITAVGSNNSNNLLNNSNSSSGTKSKLTKQTGTNYNLNFNQNDNCNHSNVSNVSNISNVNNMVPFKIYEFYNNLKNFSNFFRGSFLERLDK